MNSYFRNRIIFVLLVFVLAGGALSEPKAQAARLPSLYAMIERTKLTRLHKEAMSLTLKYQALQPGSILPASIIEDALVSDLRKILVRAERVIKSSKNFTWRDFLLERFASSDTVNDTDQYWFYRYYDLGYFRAVTVVIQFAPEAAEYPQAQGNTLLSFVLLKDRNQRPVRDLATYLIELRKKFDPRANTQFLEQAIRQSNLDAIAQIVVAGGAPVVAPFFLDLIKRSDIVPLKVILDQILELDQIYGAQENLRTLLTLTDSDGLSAFHWAATANPEVLTLLVAVVEASNSSLEDNDGLRPLSIKALVNQTTPKKLETPLHWALQTVPSDPDRVSHPIYPANLELLIKYGAETNSLNEDGRSPLHLTTASLQVASARTLLKNGANVDLLTASGQTAVGLLARLGETDTRTKEIAELLLEEYSASVDLVGQSGQLTPIVHAILNESAYLTELLIVRGANLKTPFQDNTTPEKIALSVFGLKIDGEKALNPHRSRAAKEFYKLPAFGSCRDLLSSNREITDKARSIWKLIKTSMQKREVLELLQQGRSPSDSEASDLGSINSGAE